MLIVKLELKDMHEEPGIEDRITMIMGLCDGLMERAMEADDGIAIAIIDAVQLNLNYLAEQDYRPLDIAKGESRYHLPRFPQTASAQ